MEEKVIREKTSLLRTICAYAVPGLITLAVLVVVLILKGIWPFGAQRIDYYDNMQQVAPLYSHLWDVLHGQASLWFDWYTGLGTNVSMSVSAFSMLSPFNLMLLFIPRNMILESMTFFTVAKMVFMAVAMYAYVHKKYNRLPYAMKAAFSLMYAFCAYVLLYGSCFTCWMDVVAFFPLLMMAYERMMESGKKCFYIGMVALVFVINYYISAMVLIYILMITGLDMLVRCERSKWKEKVWNLGIGTAVGLGISAFVLMPVFLQLFHSQRGNSGGGGLLESYIGWVKASFIHEGYMSAAQRWLMLFGTSFAIAVIITGIRAHWSDKKNRIYNLLLLGVMASLMLAEGTNLMWHFGSYCGYTLRNGFLIPFTLIAMAAYYGQTLFCEGKMKKKVLAAEIAAAAAGCAAFAAGYSAAKTIPILAASVAGVLFVIVMTAVYLLLIRREQSGFCYPKALVLVSAELFIGAFVLVGPPKFYEYEPFQYGDYVQTANRLYEDFDMQPSATDRLVNPDTSLNANYPLVMKRGALSSFTAALQSDTQDWAYSFGYSKFFWWLLDSGGTAFSQTLLHVTEAVNKNDLDPEFYTKKQTAGEYSLYDTKYQMPFAVCVNEGFAETDFKALADEKDFIGMHNAFYKAYNPSGTDIMHALAWTSKQAEAVTQGYKAIEYSAEVTGKQAVYATVYDLHDWGNSANLSVLNKNLRVFVNNAPVYAPTFGDVKNTEYIHDYCNHLLYLGCFEAETVTVRVEYESVEHINSSRFVLAGLDMKAMAEFTERYADYACKTAYDNNSLTIELVATKHENMAVIPVVYSENWNVTVNGKTAETKPLAGLFTGVLLEEGNNKIVMTMEPKGKTVGCMITLITLILTVGCVVWNKMHPIRVWSGLKQAALGIFLVIFGAAAVLMFLIPDIAVLPMYLYYAVTKLR